MPPQSRAALRTPQGQDAGGTELLARAGTAAWGCGWREGPHSERCRLPGARGGRTAQDQRKPNNGIRWRIFKGSRTEGESVGNQFRLLLPAAAAACALQPEPHGSAIAWSGPTVHAAEEGSSGLPAPPESAGAVLRDCRPSQDSRMQVGREISGPSQDAVHLLGTMSACPTRKKVQTPAVCWKFLRGPHSWEVPVASMPRWPCDPLQIRDRVWAPRGLHSERLREQPCTTLRNSLGPVSCP